MKNKFLKLLFLKEHHKYVKVYNKDSILYEVPHKSGTVHYIEPKQGDFILSKVKISKKKTSLLFKHNPKPDYYKLEEIFKKVSLASQLKEEALITRSRKREHVEARHAFFIIAIKKTQCSTAEIGKFLNRDHATVLHAKKNAHIPAIQTIIKNTNLL